MVHQITFEELLQGQNACAASYEENPVSAFVKNGEINIPEVKFSILKEQFSEEELILFITKEILAGRIELPMKKYTIDDAAESFMKLKNYHAELKHGEVFTRYEYQYPLSQTYMDCPTFGNIASDYFHQRSRWAADSLVSPSPVRTWCSEKFLHSALGGLFSMKMKDVNTVSLRSCLSLRKYIASQFKPTVAKAIYDMYKPTSVLDFCSGWGDRLCGFYASEVPDVYVGIDPNTWLRDGYREQMTFYESLSRKKTANIITAPAEDVLLLDQTFDLVFTSPPYFNIEKYTDEETQSYKRYKDIDTWTTRFLFRAIENAWKALKSGGTMLINISDVYSGHQIQRICDPMNDFMMQLGGKYDGCIGMKMSKRPNSKASANGVFVEPIWIWKKELC